MENKTRYNTKPCKCGTVTSVLVTETPKIVKHERFGICRVFATEAGMEYLADNGRLIVPCRACGAVRYARKIFGTVSAVHKCGEKCRSSKGFICDCSCGGRNHGAGFSA